MKKMLYMEAIREAMRFAMENDPTVLLFGEDVGAFGGCFGVSGDLFAQFGEDRVHDTPISEGAFMGAAVGAAATGLRPIAELMFIDFVTVALDQIVNQAAKMRYMFGGKIHLPMVVRLPAGGGTRAAAQHSQSLEAWLCHVPGLKVVFPSCSEDAYGLLLSSIADDNPVMFVENKVLYGMSFEVPDEMGPIPLGVGDIKKAGTDVTVVATGRMVVEALAAADILEKEGISIEVIDPRTLIPLDKQLIFDSIAKTHKVIVVSEETKTGAFTGEIAAIIAEEAFDSLDAPIVRIGAFDIPIPFSPVLEDYDMPNAADIVDAVKGMM